MESNPINDSLTNEGLLLVTNMSTGKSTDVRSLMGITPEEIKDERLREVISHIPTQREKADQFNQEDILEYDTGKDGDADHDYSDNWAEWWQEKEALNK